MKKGCKKVENEEEKLNINEENDARRGKKRDRRGKRIKKKEISDGSAPNDHLLSVCRQTRADRELRPNSTLSKTPTWQNIQSWWLNPKLLQRPQQNLELREKLGL